MFFTHCLALVLWMTDTLPHQPWHRVSMIALQVMAETNISLAIKTL